MAIFGLENLFGAKADSGSNFYGDPNLTADAKGNIISSSGAHAESAPLPYADVTRASEVHHVYQHGATGTGYQNETMPIDKVALLYDLRTQHPEVIAIRDDLAHHGHKGDRATTEVEMNGTHYTVIFEHSGSRGTIDTHIWEQ